MDSETSNAKQGDDLAHGGSAAEQRAAGEQAQHAPLDRFEELQAVYDGMFDGLLIADRDTKEFLAANAAICAMLGYSEQELLRMSVADVHPPDALPHVFEQFSARVEGERAVAESVPFRRSDGSVFYADVAVSPGNLTYHGRPCLIGFVRDVTERKQAQDALRTQRDFSASLLRASPAFFVAISAEGRTLMMNEAMLTALGYTQEEAVGTDYLQTFVPPSDHESLANIFDRLVDSHEPTLNENRVLTKDGRELLVEWHGRPVFNDNGQFDFFFGVGIDITQRRQSEQELARHRDHLEDLVEERTSELAKANLELHQEIAQRKQAQRELAESRERFRTLFQTTPHGIVDIDTAGNILAFNRAYQSMLGYSEAELGGMNMGDLIPEQHRQRVLDDIRSIARQQPEPTLYETQHITKDGRVIDCQVAWAYRHNPQGDVVGFVSVVTDVTETKRAAEAVEKDQQLLRQLLDLQERERKLVAYEIHDGLAQQLSGALMWLQTFSQEQHQDAERAQHCLRAGLQLLNESIDEARRLIGGLRPPVLDEAGIAAAIYYLIGEHQQRGGPTIEFVHRLPPGRLAPPLETAIFRIVQESISNAVRHSQTEKISVELLQHDERVHLEVQDWGIGFDPQKVEENRFGLRGIRERARLLGGEAVIDTAPGKGTRVTVEFPLLEEAAPD